jgi:hypothetical protein
MQVAVNLKILKSSGTYLKRKAYQYLVLWISCLIVFGVMFLTLDPLLPLYIDLGRYDPPRAVAMILPLIGMLVFYRRHRDYKRGFEGENQVTRVLSSALSDDYVLINDVQLDMSKRSNIDHIVLGPTGIFALETKNHGGKILCYEDSWTGTGPNPFVQARVNASRVYKVIEASGIFVSNLPWIQAVAVFANNKAELEIRKAPSNVEVLKIDDLPNYITQETRRLSAQEIELVSKEILNVHANVRGRI